MPQAKMTPTKKTTARRQAAAPKKSAAPKPGRASSAAKRATPKPSAAPKRTASPNPTASRKPASPKAATRGDDATPGTGLARIKPASPPSRGASGGDEREQRATSHGSRAVWKGTLAFGLVYIPVTLHTAVVRDDLPFRQLDKTDNSPVGNRRYNKKTGEEVAYADIVRGFEVDKDEYVVFDDDELASVRERPSDALDVDGFVPIGSIPPVYFETPYHAAPEKRAQKAYRLFAAALESSGRAAIGTLVMRGRAHLAAVIGRDGLLVVEMLRFEHEVRAPEGLDLPEKGGVAERELAMAEELIGKLAMDFDPARYVDQYRDEVLALVAAKKKGEVVRVKTLPTSRAEGGGGDLFALLQKSLQKATKAAA